MFVLGSAELIVVGVLDLIATDLGVSIPAAGTLVTAYALGLAIGGPIVTALTVRLNKRIILAGGIVVFIVANLLPLLIADYTLFIVARVIAGSAHGLFVAVAFVVGMSIVPPERAGRAISVIISGVTVSAALGVPLGTLLGQAAGWRGSFTAIVVLSVGALIATATLTPSVPGTRTGVAGQAKYAFAPRVLAVLGLNFLAFTSLYSVLTYIVPFLRDVTGITGGLVSVFLFAYGLATAVGSFGGGRFADRNAARALIMTTTGTAAALLVLFLVGSSPVLVAVVMLIWGLFAFGMAPSLQLRTVTLAGPGGQLASSLPASSINLGVAVGPIAGGVALSSFDASATVIAGTIIAGLAVLAAVATSYLKPPVVDDTSKPAEQPPADEAEAA